MIYAYDATNPANLSTKYDKGLNRISSPLIKKRDRILLGRLKPFKLSVVLCLLVGIFANSVMAEVCFCGEACSHVFQKNVKQNASFPFHNHCVGNNCKSCNFEDGQTLKARHLSGSDGNLKSLYTPLIIFTLSSYHADNHILGGFTPYIYALEKFQSLPLFLNNCSLLC